jgi:hypothetical protein
VPEVTQSPSFPSKLAPPVSSAPQLEMMIDEREEERKKYGKKGRREGETEKGGIYTSWFDTQRRRK